MVSRSTRQSFCGDLHYYEDPQNQDVGRPENPGDTQEEMGAYNEFSAFGEDMDNPVAPWFVNGDDENGGPGASTYLMG